MARVNNLSNFLTDVASAIKTKKGSQTAIPAANFDTEILAIPVVNNEQKTVTPNTSGFDVEPSSGYTGLSRVTVNPVTSAIDNNIQAQNIKDGVEILGVTGTLQGGTYQSKSLEITQNNSTNQITPDTGYDALSAVEIEVNVDAVMTNSDYNTALDLADDILGEEPPAPIQAVTYGIKRLLSSTSPTWIRTDDSENMVANATIGGVEGTNDFDTAEIYKDIITQNYNTTTKQVVAEYDDQNFTFSPSDNDIKVMTYIPEFWAKRWQDNEYEYIQITNQETVGFTHIPSRRVGRYTTSGTSSVPTIKSGQMPLVGISLLALRTVARSINTDIALMDIWTWNILQILYLVEYASYNSQDKLGRGYVDGNNSALASGSCDSLGMKSGCVTNDGKHAVIYRGVENFFGNIYQWLDGINFVGRQSYVCTNYTQYASDTTVNYIQLGYICPSSNNYIRNLGYDSNSSLVMLPSAVGGSDTSGITDYYYGSNSGNRVSKIGGYWNHGSTAGSFFLRADDGSSYADSSIGGRFVQYDSTAI